MFERVACVQFAAAATAVVSSSLSFFLFCGASYLCMLVSVSVKCFSTIIKFHISNKIPSEIRLSALHIYFDVMLGWAKNTRSSSSFLFAMLCILCSVLLLWLLIQFTLRIYVCMWFVK